MPDDTPASERPTETMTRPPPLNCPNAGLCQELPVQRTDAYAKDQKVLLRWLGGVLALACLSWGVWVTTTVFTIQTQAAVAASEAKAIQVQLARIEAQLTEIQRDLRTQVHRP
jgi:hypothetical protein